ncbi:hypothetical protein Pelo_6968 [Pelomyxa schiedti]|nr:hypothetical protein Pelo_6968 [Pelomyxa schiedti]
MARTVANSGGRRGDGNGSGVKKVVGVGGGSCSVAVCKKTKKKAKPAPIYKSSPTKAKSKSAGSGTSRSTWQKPIVEVLLPDSEMEKKVAAMFSDLENAEPLITASTTPLQGEAKKKVESAEILLHSNKSSSESELDSKSSESVGTATPTTTNTSTENIQQQQIKRNPPTKASNPQTSSKRRRL